MRNMQAAELGGSWANLLKESDGQVLWYVILGIR